MKRPFFRYEAQNDTEVDIHIYGAIGWDESQWGDGTNNTAYALVSLIKRLDKAYSRINIHINSPGGIIDEGLAIYNTLKQAKAEIHTYNSGLTASMASIIMLAGKTHMPKTSIYHLHRASTIVIGNINDFEAEIEDMKVFEATLQQAIVDKTNMSIEDIQAKWFDGKEHYMTAEQANEFGFVDFLEETKVKTPANIENLKDMTYREVLDCFKTADSDNNILGKIKNFFNPNTNKNQSNMAKELVFKAKLTMLLALIGFEQFTLNDNGKVEIEIDHAYRINDDLEARSNEINGLKTENGVLREEQERLQATINDLQAKLDGKAADGIVNIKNADNSTTKDDAAVKDIDNETSDKLKAYNKTKRF